MASNLLNTILHPIFEHPDEIAELISTNPKFENYLLNFLAMVGKIDKWEK